ncbi:MAG: CPBP family intramembrane metalloprotease [Candidatus Omnitrophica bacterium]|nr:CPBP family intramembrane metalloprotease [Candidatus Omnitrophota bacterium]
MNIIRQPMLYFLLLGLIALFAAASFIGQDRAALDEMAHENTEIVSNFEKQIEARFKEGLKDADSARELLKSDPAFALLFVITAGVVLVAMPLGGLVLLVYLFVRAQGKEWIGRVHDPPPCDWRVSDIGRVAVLFVFVAYCVSMAIGLLAGAGYISEDELAREYPVASTLALDLWAAFLVLVFARLAPSSTPGIEAGLNREGSPMPALGLVRKGWARSLAWGGVGYLCILPVFALSVSIVMGVAKLIQYEPPTHPLVTVFVAEESPITHAFSLILGLGVGPVVEELFFRGFCYAALKASYGVGRAIVVSSLLFSVLHWNPFSALPIFCLGVALAYLYEKTGTLTASIAMHAIHNGLLILGLLLMKRLVGA